MEHAEPVTEHVRHPIRLVVTDDLQRNRLTVFFRLILAIPHLIWVTVWGIVAALAATLAGLVLISRSAGTGRAAVFPAGAKTGCVALDMSASIAGPVYARVATTLKGIVDANQSICLVMFSDTAYELLPPNSPPGSLAQFIPYFVPVRYYGSTPVFSQTPWDTFMGGTRIATGLEMARVALARAGLRHGAILLVSDLDDSNSDQGLLDREALKLRAQHVPVRIVPLFAAARDVSLFKALFGERSITPQSPRVCGVATAASTGLNVCWQTSSQLDLPAPSLS